MSLLVVVDRFLGECVQREDPEKDMKKMRDCCENGVKCLIPDSILSMLPDSMSSKMEGSGTVRQTTNSDASKEQDQKVVTSTKTMTTSQSSQVSITVFQPASQYPSMSISTARATQTTGIEANGAFNMDKQLNLITALAFLFLI